MEYNPFWFIIHLNRTRWRVRNITFIIFSFPIVAVFLFISNKSFISFSTIGDLSIFDGNQLWNILQWLNFSTVFFFCPVNALLNAFKSHRIWISVFCKTSNQLLLNYIMSSLFLGQSVYIETKCGLMSLLFHQTDWAIFCRIFLFLAHFLVNVWFCTGIDIPSVSVMIPTLTNSIDLNL